MARKILGFPDKRVSDRLKDLPEGKGEVRARLEQEASAAMAPETCGGVEDEIIAALDEKAMIIEYMRETLPTFRRLKHLKDPESIMDLAAVPAAKTQVHLMTFGNDEIKERVSRGVLDRVLGKPVERKISVSGDLHRMSEQEVDRELARLFRKLGPESLAGIIPQAGSGRQDTGHPEPALEGAEI